MTFAKALPESLIRGGLYKLPDGKISVFLGYRAAHCQLHGEFMGYHTYFLDLRVPPDGKYGKKGVWKSGVSVRGDISPDEAVLLHEECPIPYNKDMLVARGLLAIKPRRKE